MIKKICFVGHVDSGKTSLSSKLFVDCGGLSKHELEKIKKDCAERKIPFLPSVFDIYDEERVRSKTHEFCLVDFNYNSKTYQIIDNPGHQSFIRSMIEGISYFNPNEIIACVIISARKGEFDAGWYTGQTKEDILLVRGVGIRNVFFLVNKLDTVDWSEKTFNDIKNKMNPFVTSCKFDNISYIPVSYLGDNLILKSDNTKIWYSGKTLMEEVENIHIKEVPKSLLIFPSEWNKMSVNIMILELKEISLITSGFECILHYNGEEYDIVFENVKVVNDRKRNFLKMKDTGSIIVSSLNKPFVKKQNMVNLIYRYNNFTIGFGRILEIIE